MSTAGGDGPRRTDRAPAGDTAGGACHGRAFDRRELAGLVELAADWLWETDAQNRFSWISEGYARHTGQDPRDRIGRPCVERVASVAAGSGSVDAHLETLEAHRPFRDFVFECGTGEASCRWVSVSGAPRFDADGGFLGYRGTARNVTATLSLVDELREARRALSLSEVRDELGDGGDHDDKLMAALDAMRDGFCYYDADDRLLLCNRALVDLYPGMEDVIRPGTSYETILDASLERGIFRIGDVRRERWRAMALERRRTGRQSESVVQLADGRFILHRDIRTEDGGSIGVRTDITELKLKEAGLKAAKREAEAARQRLQSAIDALSDGFVLWDAEDRLVACNDAFRRQFDFLPSLAEGRTFSDLFLEFARTGVVAEAVGREEEWVRGHAEQRAAELGREIAFQTHDGRWIMRRDQLTENGDRVGIRTDITEHKLRQQELARATEAAERNLCDLKSTIEAMRMGVVVLDSDLNSEIVNQAFYDIWKVSADDVPSGSPFRALMEINRHKGIYDVADEDWEDYVAGRLDEIRAGNVEPREFRRADGRTLVYAVRALSGGKRLVSYYDISRVKQREAEAEQARSRLAHVLESLPAGVMIYDRDDNFVLANGKMKRMLPKLEPAFVPGVPFAKAAELAHAVGYLRASGDPEVDALYDDDRQAWLEAYLRQREQQHSAFEQQDANGRWYQVHRLRAEDGTFVGVRLEISELKQREAALRESMRENELFRNLTDNVPVAIYAKRPDLKLIYVNKGWCDLTGLSREHAIGKTDAEIFGAAGEAYMHADREVLETGNTVMTEEEATTPQGEPRFQIARKSSMIASDGSLYLIGSTTDVTELKQRERELRVAQEKAVLADRAKSEFLANMSHEIRTPMNGVLGMAELLASTELDSRQKTFTDIIVKSGNALLTIINDILDFSKIDAGQLVLDPAPFNLVEAVEDVAALVSTRAKEKDLELIARVDPELAGSFVGDVGRIRQIITNLLGNAVKFTEAGHVLVDVVGEPADAGTRLRVSVTDTGIGIPADKLELVFDKFSQVDGSSTRRHEGTGLGLAITSRLIELMGGEIGVESEEGRGSTFWFTVTLPEAPESGEAAAAPVDVTGARVLIVDDNAVNRSILSEQLSAWGFDSCAAESGEEGLRVLAAAGEMGVGVDCVVLDYQMPGMAGTEMAQHMRADPATADVPIILLTSVDESIAEIIDLGVKIEAQLVKPTRSAQLRRTITSAIRRHRSRGREAAAAQGREADRAQPAAPALSAKPVAAFESVRGDGHRIDVLVAEDVQLNQLVFTQILAQTPYSFRIVDNGRLAVEAFAELNPRVVLMDVSMPEMNGFDATEAIRRQQEGSGAHVPIVGVTAHAIKGDREKCFEAGMDDYLSKPISPDALVEKIERWIGTEGAAQSGTR